MAYTMSAAALAARRKAAQVITERSREQRRETGRRLAKP